MDKIAPAIYEKKITLILVTVPAQNFSIFYASLGATFKKLFF
jgi:hypothetical protein